MRSSANRREQSRTTCFFFFIFDGLRQRRGGFQGRRGGIAKPRAVVQSVAAHKTMRSNYLRTPHSPFSNPTNRQSLIRNITDRFSNHDHKLILRRPVRRKGLRVSVSAIRHIYPRLSIMGDP